METYRNVFIPINWFVKKALFSIYLYHYLLFWSEAQETVSHHSSKLTNMFCMNYWLYLYPMNQSALLLLLNETHKNTEISEVFKHLFVVFSPCELMTIQLLFWTFLRYLSIWEQMLEPEILWGVLCYFPQILHLLL